MATSAVTLVDCVCVQARHERPRLCARAFRCRSFTLHTRSLFSVSALSDLQHVTAHRKTAPECHDHSENEEAVKVDSRKARRKGRTRKASAPPPETQQNFSETNPGFSLVRSVVNAEDSSNEKRDGATSNDVSHQGKSGIGKITSQGNVVPKKKLAKRVAELPLRVQTELPDNGTNDILVHADNLTGAINDMNIGSSDSSCQGNHDRTSLQHSSVSSGNKPRRRKSKHEVLKQGSCQSLLVTRFSDSKTACRKASGAGHTAQDHCKADDNRINEYAHVDECIESMKLEYDADLGEVGFERSVYMDCLSSHPSFPSTTEELANEGSKVSGRKKQGRNVQLKQRISGMVDKMEGLGNPSLKEKHSDAGKIIQALDKTALTNQSRNPEGGLLEQGLTAEVSPQKLSRYDMQVQQSDPEASKIGECADLDKTADVECASKKFANASHYSRKLVTDLNSTAGSDFQSSLQKENSRFYQSVKRSKRSRKQSEDIIVDVDACKVSQGMCIVRWLVETHLDENQKLFLVGENSYLGAWDSSMGLVFTRCEEVEQANLWQAHCQVPYGAHSEYNYFVQVGDEETGPRIWRPGPKLFFAAPPEISQEREVIVKDFLDFNVANKLPALLWEGLQNEIGFPAELKRFLGDDIMVESLKQSKPVNLEIISSKSTLEQKEALDVTEQKEEWKHVVLEEVVKEVVVSRQIDDSILLPNLESEDHLYSINMTPKLRKLIRKRVFPREEPWLMESMILYEKGDMPKSPSANFAEKGQEADTSQETVAEKILGKEEISTEILINSSKSTMERIAILENGKLVELLLKPVNSDIIVGNVYLGIVKKLLPGMTGVFVDIGHPRVALLTITKNVYPFTFPPIGSYDKSSDSHVRDADGHLSGDHGVSCAELSQDLEKCDDPADEDWKTEDEDDEEDEVTKVIDDGEELASTGIHSDPSHEGNPSEKLRGRKLLLVNEKITRPITVNFGQRFRKWRKVEEGMRIIVQVKREPLGKKGPKVCAFPQLSSRFWVLGIGGKSAGISKKIHGPERRRLKDLANLYRKPGFELTVRTEAAGQSPEDLEKDLMRLLETWEDIVLQAEGASFAAQNGQDGAVPALLHRAMGQTLSVVRDFFAEKVQRMVVDSAQTYQEVTSYLQEVAPQLQNRVELYTGTSPIFDVFNLEDDINKLFDERVQLPNGAYLVIEETEALVTIDVNGGAGMLGKNMKSAAILETNLAAARQIAAELRLRDIGGIIVIDFIDMDEDEHESLVYEEMRNAIQSDRSIIYISEISELGLMEVTRRRVRPSVTFMISDPCACCHGTGRVEALETTFSKIERAILRLVANHLENIHFDGRTWKKVLLRVDPVMFEFLTKKQRAAQLSSCLKVYIILKVGREMSRGSFELSELNLESERHCTATTGQQQRSLRKAVRLGAGGASKDLRP